MNAKLRLLEPGWEKFTGDFGPVRFVDGVSVDEVNPLDAQRLSNLVRLERLDGTNPSTSQLVIDSQTIKMDGALVRDVRSGEFNNLTPDAPTIRYTEEQLVEIADTKGIKGLREIADPMGLKSTSIATLIQEILKVQGGTPKPEFVSAPSDEAVVNADATPPADPSVQTSE